MPSWRFCCTRPLVHLSTCTSTDLTCTSNPFSFPMLSAQTPSPLPLDPQPSLFPAPCACWAFDTADWRLSHAMKRTERPTQQQIEGSRYRARARSQQAKARGELQHPVLTEARHSQHIGSKEGTAAVLGLHVIVAQPQNMRARSSASEQAGKCRNGALTMRAHWSHPIRACTAIVVLWSVLEKQATNRRAGLVTKAARLAAVTKQGLWSLPARCCCQLHPPPRAQEPPPLQHACSGGPLVF